VEIAHSVDVATRFASIDTLLGEASTRFFGEGYRHITRSIRDVVVSSEPPSVRATASIHYPKSWSTKRDRELRPHLSSIDAVSIAALLCDVFLRSVFADAEAAKSCWIERCALKSGKSATMDLDRVAATTTLVRTEPSSSPERYRSHFTSNVGSLVVELTINHPIAERRDVNREWSDIEDVLGDLGNHYYGAAFAASRLGLMDIELDDRHGLTARLDIDSPLASRQLLGLGADYYPFVSQMTTIVGIAQLAQVLLYRIDGIERSQSNNLWMRKICLESTHPAPAGRGLRVATRAVKSSVLPIAGSPWRTADFVTSLPGIQGTYTLAHQLPTPSTSDRPPLGGDLESQSRISLKDEA
jgi:hypothetical protein